MGGTGDSGGPFRFAIGLEYDGTRYSGWQNQSRVPTVQAALNRALAFVADGPVSTLAAGRTDAGVHAVGQVVHVDVPVRRTHQAWWRGANSHLPEDIAVLWVRDVPQDFHARYSARSRTYRYLILNRPVRPALEANRAWWLRHPLDAERMHEAGQTLLGEHDFSAFRGAGCQAHSPVRRLIQLNVSRTADWVVIDCCANGFLYHMVRNIVGSLARVGRGEADGDWLAKLLDTRDRRLAAMTAPARGLYLAGVEYPSALQFPATSMPLPGALHGGVAL